jgi:hypothetical protein
MTTKHKATKPLTLEDSIEPAPKLTGAQTMKAIVQTGYGTAPEDILRFAGDSQAHHRRR